MRLIVDGCILKVITRVSLDGLIGSNRSFSICHPTTGCLIGCIIASKRRNGDQLAAAWGARDKGPKRAWQRPVTISHIQAKEMAIVRILRGRTIFQVSKCPFNNIFCNDLQILIFKLSEPDCCTVRMLEFHTFKNGACKLKTDLIYEGVNYICFTLDIFV